jgi:hypothetical protein
LTLQFLSLYRFVYHSVLDPLFCNVLPFIWMTVFSLLTLKEICKSRHFAYNQLSFDGNGNNGGSVKTPANVTTEYVFLRSVCLSIGSIKIQI